MEGVDQKTPAIVGGVIVGVLSVIPIVSAANICCCFWALVGGITAAKLLIDRSPQPVKAGDGALIGLMAGIIGGAIYIIVGLPLSALTSGPTLRMFENFSRAIDNPQVQEIMRQAIERAQAQTFAQHIIQSLFIFIIGAVILASFTVLGGLLGVALFEKRKGQAPPPPPPYPPYPPPYPPNYPPSSPPPPATPPRDEGGGPGA